MPGLAQGLVMADDVAAGPVPRRAPHRTSAPPRRRGGLAAWLFRAPLVMPFAFMAPVVASAIEGRPGGVENVSAATADVLGTSSLIIFVLMLTITPVHTVTGWRWHLGLRRDFGIAMFAVAATDLVLAALTTADTFPGGLVSRVAGRALLVAGTSAVLLAVPLVLTANRRAQRWLGPHWKTLHRLTYAIWALILLHLLLLFGLRSFFVDALVLSVPLAVLRVPAVRRWWTTTRRTGRRRIVRTLAAVVALAVFAVGLVPFVRELVSVGTAAFTQHPIVD